MRHGCLLCIFVIFRWIELIVDCWLLHFLPAAGAISLRTNDWWSVCVVVKFRVGALGPQNSKSTVVLAIVSTVYEVYTRADLEAPGELASVMLTSVIVFFAYSAKKTHTVTGSNSAVFNSFGWHCWEYTRANSKPDGTVYALFEIFILQCFAVYFNALKSDLLHTKSTVKFLASSFWARHRLWHCCSC